MRKEIHGIAPVMSTPFTAQGEVDIEAMAALIRHLVAIGSHGVTLFGLVTEFHKLTDTERESMARCLLRELDGTDVYSLISVTDHSTEVAVQSAKRYESMGADAIMLLPPHFMNPPVESIHKHIERVLEAVNLPVLIQYAPIETGKTIPVQTMAAIANRYPHAMFKIEPNPPMEYIRDLLALAPQSRIMLGYAGLYMLDVLEVGGKGTIPGCSFAEIYLDIHNSWLRGDKDRARAIHARLLPYIRLWMSNTEYLISVEKRIACLRGLIPNSYCRVPDYALSEDDERLFSRFFTEFADYFPGGSPA